MNPNQWYGRSTEHTILSLTAQIGHKHEESRCLQAKFVPLCKDIITKLAAGMYAFLSGGRCKSMTRSTNGHIDHMGFYLGLETTTRVLAQACQVVKERLKESRKREVVLEIGFNMFQQLWKYSLFSIRRTHFSSILQSSPQTGNTPRFKNSTHYHRVYRYILIYWDIDIRRNLAVNSPSMKSTQSECSLYGQGTKYSRCMGASNESAWQCLPQNMFTVQQGCLSQIKQPLYIYIYSIYIRQYRATHAVSHCL